MVILNFFAFREDYTFTQIARFVHVFILLYVMWPRKLRDCLHKSIVRRCCSRRLTWYVKMGTGTRIRLGQAVDSTHYKHPLPERVYDIYRRAWGDIDDLNI